MRVFARLGMCMQTFEGVDELVAKGQRFCLATIIETQDPAVPLATKAIVFRDGSAEAESGT